MSDKSSWLPTMAGIIKADPGFPSMVAYDRYGQGLTEDRDPQDRGREEGYGHDVRDAAVDLHQLVGQVCNDHPLSGDSMPRLILVANSIGCAIARLFAQEHLEKVAGIVLLDSVIANSNFEFWPDPDAEGFDANQLPVDIRVEMLREQRAKFKAIFSPGTKNREGLDRRNLASLLPHSDQPSLVSPLNRGPFITVVGHDFETFAQESLRVSPVVARMKLPVESTLTVTQSMGLSVSLTMKYANPPWHEYNEGLAKLTDVERAKGPIIAPGCGHFIQRDNPGFVVQVVLQMWKDIQKGSISNWSKATGA